MRFLIATCMCLFLASCDNPKNNNGNQSSAADDEGNSCSSNWEKCKDNADLANNWSGMTDAQVSCKMEAEKRAQYGTPTWPWLPFSSFYPGTDYVPAGKIILIEKEAQFQNRFSAMVHSEVWCLFDLRAKTVTNVVIAPKDSDAAVVAELQARQWIPLEPTSGDANNGGQQQSPSAAQQPSTEPQSSVQPAQTAPPSGGDDAMASRFGNTVVTRSPTAEWHLWYRADGTFTGREARSNYNVSGTWTRDGDNICLTYQPPLSNAPNPSCAPVTAHQVGDSWYSNGATLSLVQGIQ